MKRKVLIYTRFEKYGGGLGIGWRPDYSATVVEDTPTAVKVKRYWFSFGDWLPKDGMFTKVIDLI